MSDTMQNAITPSTVENWLERYGSAWESRDPDAVEALFTPDARYYETPYADPFEGAAGVREYWARVTSDQRDIAFDSSVVAVTANTGIARWSATFMSISGEVKVELNGVFILEFDADGRCAVLHEWWHAR